jgi:hypothetical protein
MLTSDFLSLIDLLIVPFLLILVYFIGNSVRSKNIEDNPSYRYYVAALMVKMIGAIGVCLIYVFYYKGGDTLAYYKDAGTITRMFLKSPVEAIRLTLFDLDQQSLAAFDSSTSWPLFTFDRHAFAVDRFTWFLYIFSFTSYIGQAMFLSLFCFPAIWRLYQTMIFEFPNLQKQMAIAVLFVPSVVFWGSGLLKDTITFAAVCLITSSLHQIARMKKAYLKNAILIIFGTYLLLQIKPYIFFALMPGTSIWLGGIIIGKMNNKLLKNTLTPVFILVSIGAAYGLLKVMGSSLGEYQVENVLNKAAVTQQDLKQDYYGGSSFDIGSFDPTVGGILKKAPLAINAALFRPYLWEARNPAMIMSAIENFIMMMYTIYFLWKLRVINLFRLVFRHHFLFFSLSFSIFFAFSIGLTTSNFGSMVRYKIPAMPFYIGSLFIIASTYADIKKKKEEIIQSSEGKKLVLTNS